MVDIHCHVLPGIDDGAKSWEIAVEMCRLAREDGIEHIVATPHANSRFRYERAAFIKVLQQLSDRIGGRPELSLGCDFHFSYDNYLDLLHHPSEFTIGNTQYVLVELDDYSLSASLSDSLRQLLLRGLIPIITHPERHLLLRKDLTRLLKWSEMGCLVQVTADSIVGKWGTSAKAAVELLIKHNAVHVIATDAHGIDSRLPILSKARNEVATLAGEALAQALVRDNPLSIINGQAISEPTKHSTSA
jgi:protein-tyrosine phosphatase